jgi:branched-chain amino acid transport system substrate-binding protein
MFLGAETRHIFGGMVTKKTTLLVLVLGLLAFSLLGCGTGTSQENTQGEEEQGPTEVLIGVYLPEAREPASKGDLIWEGIRLACEMYPEVIGLPVRLHLVGGETDEAGTSGAAGSLIDQSKVVALIGSFGPSAPIPGGDAGKDTEIPVIDLLPVSFPATQDDPYCFRLYFSGPFQGRVMARYAYENLNAKNAVIIRSAGDDYAAALAGYFKEAFLELSGDDRSVLAELTYDSGDQDFTIQLLQTASLAPDVVFAPGSSGDSALLIRRARQLNITVPFLGGFTWEAPEFIEIGGKDVEGAVLSTHYSVHAPGTEANEEFREQFVEAYKAKYGKDPNVFAALGYDGCLMVLDAVRRANSARPEDIRSALAGTKDLNGVTGTITVDEDRNAIKSAVILQVKGGEFQYLTTVEPF